MPRRLNVKNGEGSGSGRHALLRYVAVWLAGGALVAAALVAVIADDEAVTLPPVKQTRLETAARDARCELRRVRPGETIDPPVVGPRVAPALAAGVYDEPPATGSVVAALREGSIVVHYRLGLDEDRVEQLEELQHAVPDGTIVVPTRARTRYEVAVTAWRRLLGCAHFEGSAIDALRLFRGRFIGRGPDGS